MATQMTNSITNTKNCSNNSDFKITMFRSFQLVLLGVLGFAAGRTYAFAPPASFGAARTASSSSPPSSSPRVVLSAQQETATTKREGGMVGELGIPCEDECTLQSYPNLPESVHPGVLSGQAMVDLLQDAKKKGKENQYAARCNLSIHSQSCCVAFLERRPRHMLSYSGRTKRKR